MFTIYLVPVLLETAIEIFSSGFLLLRLAFRSIRDNYKRITKFQFVLKRCQRRFLI